MVVSTPRNYGKTFTELLMTEKPIKKKHTGADRIEAANSIAKDFVDRHRNKLMMVYLTRMEIDAYQDGFSMAVQLFSNGTLKVEDKDNDNPCEIIHDKEHTSVASQ
jgi:hypothetical protein